MMLSTGRKQKLFSKMYQICGICLLMLLSTTSAAKKEDERIVEMKKKVQPQKLSAQRFHDLNVGHLIYNYYSSRAEETGHLKNFHNLQYTAWVEIGDPGQEMNVIIDTGTADIMLFSKSHCTFPLLLFSYACYTRRGFDESLSYKDNKASFKWLDGLYPAFHLTYGKSELQGFLMWDKFKIGDKVASNALIGLIEHWDYSFSHTVADGIIGFGLPGTSNFKAGRCLSHITPEDKQRVMGHTTIAKALSTAGAKTIGFHLYKDKKGNEVGQLVLGSAENENKRYKGEIMWFSQSQIKSIFWRIPLTKLKFIHMADGEIVEMPLTGQVPIPDPGTSMIAGPPGVIEKINEQLFKGMKQPKRKNKYGSVEFDCDFFEQLPMVTFIIQGKGFILEPKDYVKRFGSTCTSGFASVPKLGMLVVGDTFIRKFYTVFDIANERIGFAESIPPSQK